MKKYVFLLVALAFLTACDNFEVTDDSFTFNIYYKQATFICYDIYPQYNGIKYTSFVATLDDLERLHTHGLIDSIYSTMSDNQVYTKSQRMVISDLMPDTEYFMCGFYLDSNNKPIYSLVKKAFYTPAIDLTEMEFEWEAQKDTIYVTPKGANNYYWSFFLKSIVDREYANNPNLAFFSELAYYSMYDMIQYVISSGKDSESVTDKLPSIQNNDTLYVLAAPFNLRTGYCPDPQIWLAIYENDSVKFLDESMEKPKEEMIARIDE